MARIMAEQYRSGQGGAGLLWKQWDVDRRQVVEFDAQGNEVGVVVFTAEENTRADAYVAAELADTNLRTIEEALGDFTELDAILATANGAFTTNTLGAAVKVLARAIRRIIRLLIRRFDGTT